MAPRIIKRYTNRKLYDTEESRYVTLDEIGEMVKAGEDVKIIDNKTKEDLTNVTLTQIIYEDQKKPDKSTKLPINALRGIIQSGGEILFKISNPVTKMGDDLKRRAEKIEEDSQAAMRDFVLGVQRALEDTQHKIDERVRDAVDQMTHVPNLRRELDEMRAKMEQMEREMNSLTRLVEELRDELEESDYARSLSGQKSNPTLPL